MRFGSSACSMPVIQVQGPRKPCAHLCALLPTGMAEPRGQMPQTDNAVFILHWEWLCPSFSAPKSSALSTPRTASVCILHASTVSVGVAVAGLCQKEYLAKAKGRLVVSAVGQAGEPGAQVTGCVPSLPESMGLAQPLKLFK